MYARQYPRSTSVWPPHNPLPACSGPCGQGRIACPHRDACVLAEAGDPTNLQAWRGMAVGVLLGALAWGLLLCSFALLIKTLH